MRKKFAVFDIDGTFYRSSLFLDMVEQMIENGDIPKHISEEYRRNKQNWQERKGKEAYRTMIRELVTYIENNLEHIKVLSVEKAAREILLDKKHHVYNFTRGMIERLKKEGYFLIAISGSPSEIVNEFVQAHGFDAAASSIWHQKPDSRSYDGTFFSGASDKHKIIEKLIKQYNLTLKGSYAVGDSKGDSSMLNFVENPIAFNPEDTLFEEARKQGWKIVVERKNVIYELEPKNGTYILA